MKIDLHVHTKERSGCGKATEHEQIAAAMEAGLGGLVFTDHVRLLPPDRLSDLNETYAPFRVFGGVELDVSGEHLVVLGIQEDRLTTEAWTYPDLHAYVREHDGFLFLAHPYRYHTHIDVDIEARPPDAIEVRSCSTPVSAYLRIRELAARLGVPPLCNSDAHITTFIGRYYNILGEAPTDDRSLVNALRKGFDIFPAETP